MSCLIETESESVEVPLCVNPLALVDFLKDREKSVTEPMTESVEGMVGKHLLLKCLSSKGLGAAVTQGWKFDPIALENQFLVRSQPVEDCALNLSHCNVNAQWSFMFSEYRQGQREVIGKPVIASEARKPAQSRIS